jgi:hypothetical protein
MRSMCGPASLTSSARSPGADFHRLDGQVVLLALNSGPQPLQRIRVDQLEFEDVLAAEASWTRMVQLRDLNSPIVILWSNPTARC